MSQILLYLMISLSTGGLGLVFGLGNLPFAGLGAVILGIAWGIGGWRQWRWFSFLGLFLVSTGAAYGIWVGLPTWGLIISSLAALLAWDLTRFCARLRLAATEDDINSIERVYFGKMLIFTLSALAISLITVYIHIRLSFFQTIVVVIASIIGLLQLNRLLRQGKDSAKKVE
jgi:hypothetical protein